MDKDNQLRLSGDMARAANVAARALAFDPERYRHHLAHLDMSEDAQDQLLAVVHRIMGSFVDRAFGEDAAQLAMRAGDNKLAAREFGAAGTLRFDDPADTDESGALLRAFRDGLPGDAEGATRSE